MRREPPLLDDLGRLVVADVRERGGDPGVDSRALVRLAGLEPSTPSRPADRRAREDLIECSSCGRSADAYFSSKALHAPIVIAFVRSPGRPPKDDLGYHRVTCRLIEDPSELRRLQSLARCACPTPSRVPARFVSTRQHLEWPEARRARRGSPGPRTGRARLGLDVRRLARPRECRRRSLDRVEPVPWRCADRICATRGSASAPGRPEAIAARSRRTLAERDGTASIRCLRPALTTSRTHRTCRRATTTADQRRQKLPRPATRDVPRREDFVRRLPISVVVRVTPRRPVRDTRSRSCFERARAVWKTSIGTGRRAAVAPRRRPRRCVASRVEQPDSALGRARRP